MKTEIGTTRVLSWLFGCIVFAIGLLNLFLVHPVPGVGYFMLSLLYFHWVNEFFRTRFGFSVHPVVKIFLGIVLIWFTLGVSDLGDMID